MSLFIRGSGWWGFGCLQTAGSLRQHIQNRPDKLGFLRMASFLTCCCTRVTLSWRPAVSPISTYKSYRYTDTDRRVNKAPLKSTKEMEKKSAPHCTWHFVTNDDASHSQEEQKQVSRCFVNRGEGGGVSSVSRCYSDTKRKEQVSCSDVINVRSTCWSTSNIAPYEEVVHPDVCICNGFRPHPRIIWWPVTYFFRIQVFLKLTEH